MIGTEGEKIEMEKTVLLLTGQPPSGLSLAIGRLRQTELEVEKDPLTKALVSIRHELTAALPFIAQTFSSSSTSSSTAAATSVALFRWIAKDQPKGCSEAFRMLLVGETTSTQPKALRNNKGISRELMELNAFEKGNDAVRQNELKTKQPMKKNQPAVKRSPDNETIVEEPVTKRSPRSAHVVNAIPITETPVRLKYQLLRLLAYSRARLPLESQECFLIPLGEVLQACEREHPTSYSLLVRDVIHVIVRNMWERDATKVFEYRRVLIRVLRLERDWAKYQAQLAGGASKNVCLEVALNDLVELVEFVIKRCDEHEADSEEDSNSTAGALLLQSEATQMLNKHYESSAKLLAERSTSTEVLSDRLKLLGDESTDVFHAHIALRDSCFVFGRMGPDDIVSFVELPLLIQVGMRALRDVKIGPAAHKLAAALVRTAFASSISESSSQMTVQMIALLDDKDGVSKAAVELVAEMLFRDPKGGGFTEIESRLSSKHSDPVKRETAVQVLARLVELRCSALRQSEAPTDESLLDERLIKLLIQKLGDASVTIRNTAARAFVSLPPAKVVPRLCSLILASKDDEKRRSAASEALCHCLAYNLQFEEALKVLLMMDEIEAQDAAFQLTSRWVSKLGDADDEREGKWSVLIRTVVCLIVERAVEAPQLMGLARRLSGFVLENSFRMRLWCECVLNELQHDGRPPNSSSTAQQLAPFLLLRVLPEISLNDDDGDTSKTELLRWICLAAFGGSPGNQQEIKRTAVEILARIRGSLPWAIFLTIFLYKPESPPARNDDDLAIKLNGLVPGGFPSQMETSSQLKRAAVFGMCQYLMAAMSQRNEFGEDVFPFIAVKQVFTGALTFESTSEAEEEMLVMGVTEFLVLAMVCAGVEKWMHDGEQCERQDASNTAVVEVHRNERADEESSSSEVEEFVWEAFFQSAITLDHEDESKTKARMLTMNVLASTAKALLTSPSSSQSPPPPQQQQPLMMANVALRAVRSPVQMKQAAFAFCKQSIHRIVTSWNTGSDVAPLDGDLFLLFTLAFVGSTSTTEGNPKQLVNSVDLTVLVQTCIASIRDRLSHQLTAIKLLGVLLTLPAQSLASLPEGTLGRIQSTLRGTANLDPSQEARRLAGNILDLSFQ